MIFRPELGRLVLSGRKTQTRRPVQGPSCSYRPGKSYAVQFGRGQTARGRLTVIDVRQERLGDITYRDARAEGFPTTDEFFASWKSLHGTLDRDVLVWVIQFVRGDVTDTPRLLAARIGGPGGDYTSNPHRAARDEGEAISQAEQAKLSHDASARDDKLRRERLREKASKIRSDLAALSADLSGAGYTREIRSNVRAMERHAQAVDRKLGEEQAA